MQERLSKIFFSGIGGSGVSAIAGFMADKGHIVVGSDRLFDSTPENALQNTLISKGITIVPQDGSGLDTTFDFAVFSTAVESDQPEILRAKELGIPIKYRPDYLTEITSIYKTIAVSGTSGKSTTSGLLAFLLNRLGYRPNFIGGGKVKQFKTASDTGNFITGNSDYLVIEACESDGSIVQYKPEYSIILNLALDHNPVDKTAGMLQSFMDNTGSHIIINADDDNLVRIKKNGLITFSILNPSAYRAVEIEYHSFSIEFSVNKTRFNLSSPGRHNLYNALSCIALLSQLGIPLDYIAAVLHEFRGIDRRFDIKLNDGNFFVIDDYAHNPHKISFLMDTVKPINDKICYIFQPHGFAPTRMMKKEYIKVFAENLRNSDHLILLPIYYAGGTTSRDISSHDLAREIMDGGKSVEVIENRSDIFNRLANYKTYIVFGARDDSLSDFAEEIADMIQNERNS
jgi:UDP-N-acetylmuramate--alanine ligase